MNSKAEIKLLEEYRTVIDASAIVSEGDADGNITYVNDKFCEISGYSRDELIGRNHNIVRHPDSTKEIFADMWNTIKSGEIWYGTIKNCKKDGSTYHVKTTIKPVANDDGVLDKFISIRFDVTDIFNMTDIIRAQTTDALSGLPNRQALVQDLKINNSVIMALVNIDAFKDLNEVFGHDFGDKVLVGFANELKQLAPEYDIYRVAGDEFAIVDSNLLCVDTFYEICASVIARFEESALIVEDFEIELSVRIGATCFSLNPLAVAEIALDKARDNNTSFAVFSDTSEHDSEVKENIFWIKKLKDAIRQDRLLVYAQQIVPANGSDELKYECLVRMLTDDGEVIPPALFLDRAKKAKLYSSITKAIIRKSFEYFKDKNATFSINLSIEDLQNKEIVKYLTKKIEQYGIAEKLIIELLESERIVDFEHANAMLASLKLKGVKVAIDDFGSGYSNFEYIIKLNPDFLKIDGSLVKNIDTDQNAFKTVEVIVAFANKIGIKCIAEFVHSKEVAAKLNIIGVDYMQGYLFHKPTALESL